MEHINQSIFPNHTESGLQFRGHPDVVHKLPRYAELLTKAGFENLVPLLDIGAQQTHLKELEEAMVYALNTVRPPSQILTRDQRISYDDAMNEINMIRTLMEYELSQRDQGTYLRNLRIFPPGTLLGFSGVDESQHLYTTDMAETILSLKYGKPDRHFLLYEGKAADLTERKPQRFRREYWPHDVQRLPQIRKLFAHPEEGKRPSDFDIIYASSHLDSQLDILAKFINKKVFKNKGNATKKRSSRRPGFERIEMESRLKSESTSLGHIFAPGFEGTYKVGYPLLTFLMERARVASIPILLVPYYNNDEDRITLWGVSLDYFGGYEDLERRNTDKQRWLNQAYSEAWYLFPEVAFPSSSPQQTLFTFGKEIIRNAPYAGEHPLILPKTAPGYFPEATQKYLTDHAVQNIHAISASNIEKMGTPSERIESGISFLEDFGLGLRGDFVATTLRSLPASMCVTNDARYREMFGTDVIGLGIIDKNGYFPKLAKILEDTENLQLVIDRVISEAASIYWDDKASEDGRKLFFDLLFGIAHQNAIEVLEWLQPVWCSDKEWKTTVKSHLERLIGIDKRFKALERQNLSIRELIYDCLFNEWRPMSPRAIAKYIGKPDDLKHVTNVLKRMERENQIKRFGKQIAPKNKAKFGSGGHQSYYIISDYQPEYDGKTPEFISQENILAAIQSDLTTIREIEEFTGLHSQVIYSVLRDMRGLVQQRGNKWELKIQFEPTE